MKSVRVVKSSEVSIKPFVLKDFVLKDSLPKHFLDDSAKRKKSDVKSQKVTKKSLKLLAEELGLDYNDKEIAFTKKMMTAYLKR